MSMHLLLLAVLLGSGLGPRQDHSDTRGVLRARIIPISESTLPGLPLGILVELENTGTAEEEVLPDLGQHENTLRLHVTTPDGREIPSGVFGCAHVFGGIQWVSLPKGGVRRYKDWLFWGGDAPILDRPGRYGIHGRVCPTRHGWVDLEPASIEVRRPDEVEAAARNLFEYDLLEDWFRPEYFHKTPWPGSAELRERMDEIAGCSTDSPYGKYARYLSGGFRASVLFCSEAQLKDLGLDEEQRQERVEEAIRILLGLRSDDPPASLAQEIERDLAFYYHRVGKNELALSYLESLRRQGLQDPLREWARDFQKTLSEERGKEKDGSRTHRP